MVQLQRNPAWDTPVVYPLGQTHYSTPAALPTTRMTAQLHTVRQVKQCRMSNLKGKTNGIATHQKLQDGQGWLPVVLASIDDRGEENRVFADVQLKHLLSRTFTDKCSTCLEKVSAALPKASLRRLHRLHPKERCISVLPWHKRLWWRFGPRGLLAMPLSSWHAINS